MTFVYFDENDIIKRHNRRESLREIFRKNYKKQSFKDYVLENVKIIDEFEIFNRTQYRLEEELDIKLWTCISCRNYYPVYRRGYFRLHNTCQDCYRKLSKEYFKTKQREISLYEFIQYYHILNVLVD